MIDPKDSEMWKQIGQIRDATVGDDPTKGYVDQDQYHLPVGVLSSGAAGMYGVMPGESIHKGCDHKWVEVGFTHTKIVCYYCDKEKE